MWPYLVSLASAQSVPTHVRLVDRAEQKRLAVRRLQCPNVSQAVRVPHHGLSVLFCQSMRRVTRLTMVLVTSKLQDVLAVTVVTVDSWPRSVASRLNATSPRLYPRPFIDSRQAVMAPWSDTAMSSVGEAKMACSTEMPSTR